MWPVQMPRLPSESDDSYGYRVRDTLRDLEGRRHAALASQRVPGVDRSNANEWFWFNDQLLTVLFEAGAIVARARKTGRPFGVRIGQRPQLPAVESLTRELHAMVGRLMQFVGGGPGRV